MYLESHRKKNKNFKIDYEHSKHTKCRAWSLKDRRMLMPQASAIILDMKGSYYILMEWTNCYDIYNKGIFDKDIVSWNNNKAHGIIEYSYNGAKWIVVNENGLYQSDLGTLLNKDLKVEGNIYQNINFFNDLND